MQARFPSQFHLHLSVLSHFYYSCFFLSLRLSLVSTGLAFFFLLSRFPVSFIRSHFRRFGERNSTGLANEVGMNFDSYRSPAYLCNPDARIVYLLCAPARQGTASRVAAARSSSGGVAPPECPGIAGIAPKGPPVAAASAM